MIPTFVVLLIAFVFALAAFDIFAQTGAAADRGAWSLATYIWIGMWAALGGLVSFGQKVRAGQTRWLNLGELAGELFTSAFVGIVTGLLCEAANFPQAFTWALVGVSGHAGGRAIFWLEKLLQRVAEKHFGVTVPTLPQASPPVVASKGDSNG